MMKIDKNTIELSKILLKLRTHDEISLFLKEVISNSELETINLRLEVARLLLKHVSYLEITRLTGSSSATIAKVNEALKYGNGGLKRAFDRVDK